MSAIDCHRLVIVIQHRSLTIKWQVSALQIKQWSFLVYKIIFTRKGLKTPRHDNVYERVSSIGYIVPG